VLTVAAMCDRPTFMARVARTTRDSVTFIQTLAGNYDYEKTLRLSGNRLIIEHRLKNLGTEPIKTTVYDHNFLKLVPGNGGVTVTFPFAPATTAPPPPDLLQIAGNSLTYLRPMANKERISFLVTGFGPTAKDYDFTISGAGASVRVQGDQPITRMNIFSIDRVQSVEPYIAIDLAPGAEKRWTYTYTYATGKE